MMLGSGLPVVAFLLAVTTLLGESTASVLRSFSLEDAVYWQDAWGNETATRNLDAAHRVDQLDTRTILRGSGSIEIGDGMAIMKSSPRLYILNNGPSGYGDIEFTAYGKYSGFGNLQSFSGLTLAVKSNHDVYQDDPCNAAGYYAKIYAGTGDASFQKEYYHSTSTGSVYAQSDRVPLFDDGIPFDTWVGLKFRVFASSATQVTLELYVDLSDGDEDWVLVHSKVDKPGTWTASNHASVPENCSVQNGDPILRAGNACFLRSDGSEDTTVVWKNATIVPI